MEPHVVRPARDAAAGNELAAGGAGWLNAGAAAPTTLAAALDALDAATVAIIAELSVERVLQVIVDRVRPLVRRATRRWASSASWARSSASSRAASAMPSDAPSVTPPRGHGLLGVIIREGTHCALPDIGAQPAQRRLSRPTTRRCTRSWASRSASRAASSATSTSPTRPAASQFSDDDQRLVETFARHAGIGHPQRAHCTRSCSTWPSLQERERIGQDLHDGIIQSLYAVGLSLEDVRELMAERPGRGAAQRVDRAIDSHPRHDRATSATSSSGLRPELLGRHRTSSAGLADACRRSSERDDAHRRRPRPPAERVDLAADLMRRCSSSSSRGRRLSNIARHAGASTRGVSRADVADDTAAPELSATTAAASTPCGGAAAGPPWADQHARPSRGPGRLARPSRAAPTGTRVIFEMPLSR